MSVLFAQASQIAGQGLAHGGDEREALQGTEFLSNQDEKAQKKCFGFSSPWWSLGGRGSRGGAGDQVGTLPHTTTCHAFAHPHPNREGRPLTSRDPKLGAGRAPLRPWVGLGSGGPPPTHWVLCWQGSRPQNPNQAGRSRQSCRVHLSLPVASWPPPPWTPNFSEQALRRCGKTVSCWES